MGGEGAMGVEPTAKGGDGGGAAAAAAMMKPLVFGDKW